jgi:antitoxin ParD1/3/4
MSVQLTPETEALIREKVASGRYATGEELVETALRLLDERDRQIQQLRAKLQIGLDQIERGETVQFTPELLDEIEREAEEQFRRGEQPDPDVCP